MDDQTAVTAREPKPLSRLNGMHWQEVNCYAADADHDCPGLLPLTVGVQLGHIVVNGPPGKNTTIGSVSALEDWLWTAHLAVPSGFLRALRNNDAAAFENVPDGPGTAWSFEREDFAVAPARYMLSIDQGIEPGGDYFFDNLTNVDVFVRDVAIPRARQLDAKIFLGIGSQLIATFSDDGWTDIDTLHADLRNDELRAGPPDRQVEYAVEKLAEATLSDTYLVVRSPGQIKDYVNHKRVFSTAAHRLAWNLVVPPGVAQAALTDFVAAGARGEVYACCAFAQSTLPLSETDCAAIALTQDPMLLGKLTNARGPRKLEDSTLDPFYSALANEIKRQVEHPRAIRDTQERLDRQGISIAPPGER